MSAADIKPQKVCGREVDEVREIDVDGRTVVRHRTVDSLGKLVRSGVITEAMHDAGRAFQRDFQFAGLDPLRARPMDVPPGEGRASDLTDRQLDARGRVRAAMEALGGMSSPAGGVSGTSWAADARSGSGRSAAAGAAGRFGRSKRREF